MKQLQDYVQPHEALHSKRDAKSNGGLKSCKLGALGGRAPDARGKVFGEFGNTLADGADSWPFAGMAKFHSEEIRPVAVCGGESRYFDLQPRTARLASQRSSAAMTSRELPQALPRHPPPQDSLSGHALQPGMQRDRDLLASSSPAQSGAPSANASASFF